MKYLNLINNRRVVTQFLFCFVLSGLFLLIRTKSSPLYPFNDWVDVNAFFTVGKGMFNGVVPYRDIFEQKGPLLYFIFGIGYLISNQSFLGVYMIETLFFSIFLYFSIRIVRLFINRKYALFAVPLIAFLTLDLTSFTHGGSAEEISLPFLVISLFYFLKYFKREYPKSPNSRMILLNGIIAGCIVWIKYSLLGFWFGWVLAICISLLLHKKMKDIFKLSALFLLGMFISTIPWFIYFGLNGAIQDWLDTYISINFNFYRVKLSFFQTIKHILNMFKWNLRSNKIFAIILLLGISLLFFSRFFYKKTLIKVLVSIPFIMLIFGVYGGGKSFIYYFFIISPSIIFGVISLLRIGTRYLNLDQLLNFQSVLLVISSILFLFFSYLRNDNSYMLNKKKEQLFQYQFAEIINQTPNATLLNYGFLDGGVYTTTGIVPNVKHFEKQNIRYEVYPFNMDEQKRYIKERIVDYVVVRFKSTTDLSIFGANYRLAKRQEQFFEGRTDSYLLFKAKDLN